MGKDSVLIRRVRTVHRLACLLLAATLGGCSGSGSDAPPPPPADFALSVAPGSLAVVGGSTSNAATVSVTAMHGFSGSVSVSIIGLPVGATTNPPSPLTVAAGSPRQFTVTTSDATPTGTATLYLHGTSGSLAHDATVSMVTGPMIQTAQVGSVLYLQSRANGHTARIGLDTAWGGSIVEVSLDGTNFVNAHDTGREVQPALYDGAPVGSCTRCSGAWGWDPVLGGDYYDHGSPVLNQTVAATSLYTRATPLHWYPDNFGGGAATPAPSDMTFEQTVTVAAGVPSAFQVHLKLTHNGTDDHYSTTQEFPAVYVNSAYTTLVYYGGAGPWTRDATTTLTVSTTGASVYAPERWAALVDVRNQGLAVFVPGSYPNWTTAFFPQSGGSGPTGDATVYMRPLASFGVPHGAVIEGDIYLIPGDAGAARAAVYALHPVVPDAAIAAPIATIDVPAPAATVSGAGVTITGWAFGNAPVSAVNVFIDGTLRGTATLGVARPDVAAAYPQLAPNDSGWVYALDTTTLPNGAHSLSIRVVDQAQDVAISAPVPIVVAN